MRNAVERHGFLGGSKGLWAQAPLSWSRVHPRAWRDRSGSCCRRVASRPRIPKVESGGNLVSQRSSAGRRPLVAGIGVYAFHEHNLSKQLAEDNSTVNSA